MDVKRYERRKQTTKQEPQSKEPRNFLPSLIQVEIKKASFFYFSFIQEALMPHILGL
jgi:hypothetical protein